MDVSLGNCRLRSFVLKHPFGCFVLYYRARTFERDVSPIGSFWDASFGNFRSGSFAWELSHGIFPFGIESGRVVEEQEEEKDGKTKRKGKRGKL